MITLKKIRHFLGHIFVVVLVLVATAQVQALAPTKNLGVLDGIDPLVHIGAGVQSIIGPLLVGSLYELVSNEYSLQVISKRNQQGNIVGQSRPAIFTRSIASGISNSFFTVLQNSLFGRRVFVGFAKETYIAKGVEITPTTTEWEQIKDLLPDLVIRPERLNVRGNILASNLNGASGNITGQNNICVDSNGTLALCESKNPVVDLRFDECSYSGVSGEVNDTLNNITDARSSGGLLQTTDQGRVGRSLDFTGAANSYVVSNSPATSTHTDIRPGEELSISLWMRTSADPAEGNNWIAWKEGDCLGWHMRTETNGSIRSSLRIGTGCSSNTTWQINSPAGIIDDGLWHHVVFTVDRKNNVMVQYVDGARTGTVVLPSSGNSSGGDLRFGSVWNGTGIFRDGSIDEFKAFDTILTTVDVRELFLIEKTQTRSISCS
jgi:hypothetical protein